MDYETARQLAEHPIGGDLSQIKPENRDMHEKNNQLCQRYVASITAKGKGHVGRGTRIIGVSRLENSYVGEYARLENVGGVRNSTILSSREEPTILDGKATEIDTILIQKGVSISSGVIAKNSIVFEHSELTNGFTLTNSIVAPNCVLEQGEGTSFLFGPFYVSHHKGALNIGAMAPQGRVNVGAGAELVSNHPGTRPEQEANIGEGIFFGMDSTCGAPLDLSRSPYSLIGRGIHLISKQRIKFPFSLISEKSPTSQLGMGHNLIEPGTINPFFVAYNEWKYKNRNKARRHTFDLEVFRPEIIDMIIDAKNRLEHLKGSPFMREVMERDQKRTITIYTNKEIDGLGKCFMTEDGRRQGIKTYTDIITRYALRGLKREVESLFRREITSWEAVRENLATDSNPRWVHERTILERELGINIGTLTMDTVFARLNELASLENGWHEAVCQVREREWAEGGQIIDDYADAHKSPLQDSFLNEVMKPELEKFLGEIIAIRIKMVYVNPALGIMASGSAKERDVTSNI
jgi:hypothetical protein